MIVTNPKIIKSSVSKTGKVWLTLASVVLHELEAGVGFVGKSTDSIGLLQAYGTEEVNGEVIPNQKYFKEGSTLKGDFEFGEFHKDILNDDGEAYIHTVSPTA